MVSGVALAYFISAIYLRLVWAILLCCLLALPVPSYKLLAIGYTVLSMRYDS